MQNELRYTFVLLGKYCNENTGVAILKMRHGPHRFVCTVLPFITELGKEPVQLQTIRITATLHQAYTYLKAMRSFLILPFVVNYAIINFFFWNLDSPRERTRTYMA